MINMEVAKIEPIQSSMQDAMGHWLRAYCTICGSFWHDAENCPKG